VFSVAQCAHVIPVHGLVNAADSGEWSNSVLLNVPSVAFYRDLVRAPDALAAPCANGAVHAVAASNAFATACGDASATHQSQLDIVLIARELARFGLPIECASARACAVDGVDVAGAGDGWALFLNDVLGAMRSVEASCGTAHTSAVLVTPIEHFVALDGAEQRRAGVALVRAVLAHSGGKARVARAVVGLVTTLPAHETANRQVKRNVLEKTSVILAAEDYPLRAYVFHLLFWTVLMLIVVVLLAACVMHSLYGETEKDALLYRNTTSTMFANTLEMR
jgi:hypothetical protein